MGSGRARFWMPRGCRRDGAATNQPNQRATPRPAKLAAPSRAEAAAVVLPVSVRFLPVSVRCVVGVLEFGADAAAAADLEAVGGAPFAHRLELGLVRAPAT